MFQLGEYQLLTISGGRFRMDGGTMFGVVPKTLWSKHFEADDRNRIRQATNCLLVRTGRQNILIDTGYGSKLSDKERKIMASESSDPLLISLKDAGLKPQDVDMVILSHLHFDHAGGATRRNREGDLVPTFPNAEYVVQRREWVIATAEFPELRGAYPLENLLPLRDAGQLRLVDGDVEVARGVRLIVTGGHTEAHAAVVVESKGVTAVYLGDICPTSAHLPPLWGMSYDVDMLQLRRKKVEMLGQVADHGWIAVFNHDPNRAAARLLRESERTFSVAEGYERL